MSRQLEIESLYLCLKPALVARVAVESGVNPSTLEIVHTLGARDTQVEHLGTSLLASQTTSISAQLGVADKI